MHLGNFIRVIRRFRKNPAGDLCRELGRDRSYLSKIEAGVTTVPQKDLVLILEFLDQMHNREFFEYLWQGHLSSIRVPLHGNTVPESLRQLVILHQHGKYPPEEVFKEILAKYVPDTPEDIKEIITHEQTK